MIRPGVVRDSLAVAASQYVARAVLLARGFVAAAALGPHGYGGWNALNLILDYGAYATLGALQGLDLLLPGAAQSGDRGRARRLMAGAWSVVVGGVLLYGLVLLAYLAGGGGAFSAWPGWRLPLLMLGATVLQLGIQYVSGSLRAYGRFTPVSVALTLQALVGGGLGLALLWSYGVYGLVIGWIIGSAVALLVLRRALPEAPLLPGALDQGPALVRAGFPIFAYFAATLALRSVDRLALLRFGGEEPLGLYGVGLMVVGLVLYLPEATAYVLFPRMAAAAEGARDAAATRLEILEAQRALVALVPLAVGVGVAGAGPALAALLPDFRGALPALRALGIGAIFLSAATLPGYSLLAGRRFGPLLAVGVGATLLQVVLVASVASRTPEPGPVGLAAALGYGVFAVAITSLAARAWFATPGERVRSVGEALMPGVAMALLVGLTGRIGADDSWLTALARAALTMLAYLPLLFWLTRGSRIADLVARLLGRRAAEPPVA